MPQAEALSKPFDLALAEANNTERRKIWMRRYRTRKQLKALLRDDPERLLRDLGLHATAAEAECRKWFWQR